MICQDNSPITDHRLPITGELPGLYLHVPFCRGKCPYCDFYSVPALSLIDEWVSAIGQEAVLYKEEFSTFDSLYVGGGTPSVLSRDSFLRLLDALRGTFEFAANTEITVELNPEDATAGTRQVPFGRELYIEQDDFRENPPKQFVLGSHTSEETIAGLLARSVCRRHRWEHSPA
jgi:hypothetical protein